MTVNAAQVWNFIRESKEGTAFWPHFARWQEQMEVVINLRESSLPKGAKKKKLHEEQLATARRKLERLCGPARDALARAYKQADNREEFLPEITLLAKELGLSLKTLDHHAVGPHRPAQKSFIFRPAKA